MRRDASPLVGPYQAFADVYDILMSEVPYEEWVGGALRAYRLCQGDHPVAGGVEQPPLDILDLACGTGTTTFILAMKGHRVVGADASSEMLTVASSKGYLTHAAGPSTKPIFVRGDMRRLGFGPRFDVVTCFCDGLNHLGSVADLRRSFSAVRASLRPGGVFVFDMNTQYRLARILGDNTFKDEFDGGVCIMENSLEESECKVRVRLTFFLEGESGLYRRLEEEHEQTWFADEQVMGALTGASFSPRGHWDGYGLRPLRPQTERVVFSAVAV